MAAVSSPPFGSGALALPFLIEGRPAPTSPSVRGEGESRDAANSQLHRGDSRLLQDHANSNHQGPRFRRARRGRPAERRDRQPGVRSPVFSRRRSYRQTYFARLRAERASAGNRGRRRRHSRGSSSASRGTGDLRPSDAAVVAFRGPLGLPARRHDVRASHVGEPTRIVESVKRAVAEVDPNTPVAAIQTMEQTLDAQIRHLRLYMFLLGVFGAVAAVLAATGIYGVMAYSVAERTRKSVSGWRWAHGLRMSSGWCSGKRRG